MPSIRRTPLNEFNRSQALFSLAFPTLYPRGEADYIEPRLRPISYQDYLEHAMRYFDGRFARHPTWRFVAFNTLMRKQARSHGKFFAVQQSKLGGRELTCEDIEQIFRDPDSDEAQRLISSITRYTVQLRGTRPFWNRRRQDLEAYAYNLGCPGAFITFSPADLYWSSLYQHMPGYQEWLQAPEPQRMAISARLLRENPHIAAWHFFRRFTLFRDIVLKSKFNLTDYWDRYKWQKRGSPYSHGLYWMQEHLLLIWQAPRLAVNSPASGASTLLPLILSLEECVQRARVILLQFGLSADRPTFSGSLRLSIESSGIAAALHIACGRRRRRGTLLPAI